MKLLIALTLTLTALSANAQDYREIPVKDCWKTKVELQDNGFYPYTSYNSITIQGQDFMLSTRSPGVYELPNGTYGEILTNGKGQYRSITCSILPFLSTDLLVWEDKK